MIWLKKNLLFTVAMVVLTAILVVEIIMILGQRSTALAAEAEFRAKVDEFRRLAGQEVLPHDRNVDLTALEIERRREELEEYYVSMQGREELAAVFAAHPTSRPDAYFDIAGFVDEYRDKARAAGLDSENIDNSYFGFEAYASVGPPETQIARVYKERLIVAYILDRLFEARPETLDAVRRPGGANQQGGAVPAQRGQQQGGGAGFTLNPQFSAAIPGVAETSAYQVVFTGRASTLRTFLNELASFDMPLIVRSVQVAPATDSLLGRRDDAPRRPIRRAPVPRTPEPEAPQPQPTLPEGQPGDGNGVQPPERIPLVADNLSRFTVAMEFVDVQPMENSTIQ